MSVDTNNLKSNEQIIKNELSTTKEENEEDELQTSNSKTVLDNDENDDVEEEEEDENNNEDDIDNYEDDFNYNYDDDNNNNYLSDDLEDDHDENNIYLNDPEYFEYESYPLDKLDWIIEKKCEKIYNYLNLNDPLDSIYILKQFTWNLQNLIEMYDKDKQTFLKTYFSDNNNNNSKTVQGNFDKCKFSSFINIFNENSNFFNKNKKLCVNESSQNSNKSMMSNSKLQNYCNICCDNKSNPSEEMLSLDECSHYFCIDCWYMHFENLITNTNSSNFECMQTKCNKIANKDFVLKCLKNSTFATESSSSSSSTTLIDRYKKLVAMDLINESEDLQMCPGETSVVVYNTPVASSNKNQASSSMYSLANTPTTSMINMNISTPKSAPAFPTYRSLSTSSTTSSPLSTTNTSYVSMISSSTQNDSTIGGGVGSNTVSTKKCNYIVWIKSKPASRRVLCSSCQTQYCFMCLLPYHAPNSCQTIRKWNLKCQDDSETRNYLLVHTQDCPKCKVCIEKNGGCSHMTCNRCKHEFCWVCLNDWKTHGATYDCNRYKGNPEQDNAREALNRYTHYYHRWINHANSLKLEKEFKEKCQLKVNEKIMNKGGGTMVDWEFFFEAVDTLTRARYTLQYTYPYAYFLENNESKMLFENIQAELEREVENLSHSLEKVNLNDKFSIKTQMNIVEKRRKTLLKDFIE